MTSVRNTRVGLVGALMVVCDSLCALRFVRLMVANGVMEPPTMGGLQVGGAPRCVGGMSGCVN